MLDLGSKENKALLSQRLCVGMSGLMSERVRAFLEKDESKLTSYVCSTTILFRAHSHTHIQQ